MSKAAEVSGIANSQSEHREKRSFDSIMKGLEQLESLDAKQVVWNSVYKKASLALTYLKNQSRYEHIESTAFKKVPAFLKLGGKDGLILEVNESGERSLQSQTPQTGDLEDEMDPDEEAANREVDGIMAPRIFNTIDELVKFNSERDILFQAVLEKNRASKQQSNSTTRQLKVRVVPNKNLGDASDMFNTLGATDGSIERVQALWTEYLIECLSMVKTIREIKNQS